MKRKPKGYWTKEKCHEEALKYKNRTDFNKNNQHVYCISLHNNWLNEICLHMISYQKSKGYWTKEKCHEEALKYKSRKEFKSNCSTAFHTSYKNNWMDEMCSHMKRVRKPWTKKECHEEALKYKCRYDYQIGSSGSYSAAIKNKWLDGICLHMKSNNNKPRCIYVYIFSDNSVYIGLTNNIKTRNNRHLNKKNGTIYNKIENKLIYELKQLTDYINIEDAILKEEEYVEKYRNNGFIILNKIKTGSIGGYHTKQITYWIKEKCHKEALNYKSRYSFQKNSGGAYSASRKNGWLNEVCSHMKNKKYSTSY